MLYDLSLHMGYIYDAPASGARHIVRLLPLSLTNRQRLIAGSLKVTPHPDEQSNFTDFFQHSATSILVRDPHEKLDIRMQARVQVESQPVAADFSPLLAKLPDEVSDCWSAPVEVEKKNPSFWLICDAWPFLTPNPTLSGLRSSPGPALRS